MKAPPDVLTAEWSQLQAECKATAHAAECVDLLRPAVERVRALVREALCPDGWSRLDRSGASSLRFLETMALSLIHI